MKKYVRPEGFDTDPNSSEAAKIHKHSLRTFNNFIESLPAESEAKFLVNYVVPPFYNYIVGVDSCTESLETPRTICVKPKNEIFAWRLLANHYQQHGEIRDQVLDELSVSAWARPLVQFKQEVCCCLWLMLLYLIPISRLILQVFKLS